MSGISRRNFLAGSLLGGAYALQRGFVPALADATPDRPNVLFIAVDDLRPELGCYGASYIHTPNIDRLANDGVVFTRAYCQMALCNPSRVSLLLGMRPDTTRITDLRTHFRVHHPDVVTLPQQFRLNGYHTAGFGKIYHGNLGDPLSWSDPSWHPSAPRYGKPETVQWMEEETRRREEAGLDVRPQVLETDPETGTPLRVTYPKDWVRGPSWEDPDVADNFLPDGNMTDAALQRLREISDRRFFLAVGYHKPHLPFVAPKKYYDLYPPEEIELANNPFPPENALPISLHNSEELRGYTDIPSEGPLSDEKAREVIRGYYATVSYVDAQIGRLLDELDALGLRENTLIVLWGDHGFHLGDHGLWCKHTNFEMATRSPLILSGPGCNRPGASTDALTEFVDIYPTLCDLCGLDIPEGMEGISLTPLLKDPERPWKTATFSQYPRDGFMGYSMRTDRYRYNEWVRRGEEPKRELYDHRNDSGENVNIAGNPENGALVEELSHQLSAGWRESLPAGWRM